MINIVAFIKNKFSPTKTLTPIQKQENEAYEKEMKRFKKAREEAEVKARQIVKDKYDGIEAMTRHQYDELLRKEKNILMSSDDQPIKPLRIIKTARSLESINKAIEDGYKPLIKKVEPSDKIQIMFMLVRNKKTGRIEQISDKRDLWDPEFKNREKIIDESYYYPYNFKSPFAAYLVPASIKKGERVVLEDLIEDYIGESWQGNAYRLASCEAIWDGKSFEIDYASAGSGVVFG